MQPAVSVVVPVYNADLILCEFVKRLHPVLQNVSRMYELLLINDGSRDRS